jgi:hypothetical protein
MSEHRFQENGEHIYDMLGEILVVCPNCHSCAMIRPVAPHMVCPSCGTNKNWHGRLGPVGQPMVEGNDPNFGLPLWLRSPCCGQVLWAYNLRHLELMEAYVGAQLREHRRGPKLGWFNQGLFNRLPKWIKEAGHRDEVLRVIAKLKQSV